MLSFVFFAVILMGIFTLAGVFDEVNSKILPGVIWSLLTLCHLLMACANWKKQKIMSTVQIGIWSFFLGVFVSMLVFTLMK